MDVMSELSIPAIQCDHEGCDERRIITDGTKEGMPRYSWLSKGWVEIEHRDPEDYHGIIKTHFCPEHAPKYVEAGIYNE